MPIIRTSIIRRIQQDLRSRTRSAQEITEDYLSRLQAAEPEVQSFISVASESACAAARALDGRIASDGADSLGPLAAVPLGIKDTLCTAGLQTTAASRVLEGYTPSHDATSVARLKAAGGIIVGKCNCDAFAMGSTSESSAYKATRNPWDLERVPGGSSGGSAAAVAAGQCVATLGSDTGGSIRQPAHFCGVVGLKPTYGRVSRYGLIAYGSSLDCVGPLAGCVEDAALLLQTIAGRDQLDATSSHMPVPDFTQGLEEVERFASRPLEGKRIGIIRETIGEGVSPGVNAAFDRAAQHLATLGAEVHEVSLPTSGAGLPAYYVIAMSEASSNLSRYDGIRYGVRQEAANIRETYNTTRQEGLNAEVKRRILMGTYALSAGYYDAYYKRAQQVRTIVQQEMHKALLDFDALISPAAPTTAYKLGHVKDDPLEMYKGDIMTINVNLAGLPAISLPAGFEEGADGRRLPIGLQIIGKAFDEGEIIRIAHVFEQTADFACGTPPTFDKSKSQ
ncbi:g2503 [Coccomyxa viridis]|uniref:Glutamyl-tRNA(Gln) amidotransferase subunit A, chloroplastic/mitochondrial n=1 Tax=Coccomyxa viridis TaxID=1274662 RepID=A0ABP1FKI1_9CHLO